MSSNTISSKMAMKQDYSQLLKENKSLKKDNKTLENENKRLLLETQRLKRDSELSDQAYKKHMHFRHMYS